jgi:hypothetical protein
MRDGVPIRITKRYIGMINANFSVHMNIDLNKLNQCLNRCPSIISIYNPETYPAINMKIKKNDEPIDSFCKGCLSIFIFATGNIVITGGTCMANIGKAYKFITRQISEHREYIHKTSQYVPKQKVPEKRIDGYTVRQYLSCVI